MHTAYHIVGLSHCQPDPSMADNYYDQEISEPILEVFEAVLAKGELLAPSQFGYTDMPTPIDAMAGDNHYVFLSEYKNGPPRYDCPEEYSYGFAFDAYKLIDMGCGVRVNDLIVQYENEIMAHMGNLVRWNQDDLEKMNQYLALGEVDPVEVIMAIGGIDPESKRGQNYEKWLNEILSLLESPPTELRHRVENVANYNTLFGTVAMEMLKSRDNLEFVFPERLSLAAMDHAIMAGKSISWEELSQLYDVRVTRQRELWL